MNTWQEWLQKQAERLDVPDYMREVLRANGINHKAMCKGCAHLGSEVKKYVRKEIGTDAHGRPVYKNFPILRYTCGAFGKPEQDWQPDWPACGKRAEPEKKKKGAGNDAS